MVDRRQASLIEDNDLHQVDVNQSLPEEDIRIIVEALDPHRIRSGTES